MNMKHLLFSTLSLSLFSIFLFPSLGRCENLSNPVIIPNLNVDVQKLLNNNSDEISLKLADAVYLALQNNRDLKIAYLQRIIETKELAEAESKFNPTVTPELSLNLNNNQTGDDSNNTTTAGLGASLNWPLPTGGNFTLKWQGENQLSRNTALDISTNTNTLSQNLNVSFSQPLLKDFGADLNILSIKRARLAENVNVLNLKNTIAQKITDTIESYRRLLLAQERLKIEQLSVANAKKDLERLEALFEFGRIAKNDLVERQADIAQQEVNLLNTQTNVEAAISSLNRTIDLPITRKLIAIETPTPPTSLNLPPFSEMLELAKANNSGYLNAQNAVENAKFGILEAKNQQQVDLRLNFNYGFNSANNSDDTNNLSSSLILNREFGNLSQDNTVAKSEVRLQTANLSLGKTEDDLNENLKNQVRNVEDTFTQIKLAQEARKLAAERVENAKERMRLGSDISMTDIINFENSLVAAKNQELTAIIEHQNSVTRLEQFLGVTLNQWLQE
jgi:outer membrane protein TolC